MNPHITSFYEMLLICRPSDAVAFAARFFEDERVARSTASAGSSSASSIGTNTINYGLSTNPPPASVLHAIQALPYTINEDTWFADFSCKVFLYLTDAEKAAIGPRAIKLSDAVAFIESMAERGYSPSIPSEIMRRFNECISVGMLSLTEFTNYLSLCLRAALLCQITSSLIGAALRYSSDGSKSSKAYVAHDDAWSMDARALQSQLPQPCLAPYIKMFTSILSLQRPSPGREQANSDKETLAALNSVLGKFSKGSATVEEIVLGILLP